MKRTVVLALACGLAFDAAPAQTPVDGYPQRTVTFLCPFPAGGGTDILTRILAQELQDKLKRPVVVENRPGGGGSIGYLAAIKAPPDGSVMMLTSSAIATMRTGVICNFGRCAHGERAVGRRR